MEKKAKPTLRRIKLSLNENGYNKLLNLHEELLRLDPKSWLDNNLLNSNIYVVHLFYENGRTSIEDWEQRKQEGFGILNIEEDRSKPGLVESSFSRFIRHIKETRNRPLLNAPVEKCHITEEKSNFRIVKLN